MYACVYAYPLLGEPHQDPEAQRYEAALAFLVHPATFVETLRRVRTSEWRVVCVVCMVEAACCCMCIVLCCDEYNS